MKRTLALAALLICLDGSSYAANPSQNNVDPKNVGVTIAATATWQQVAKADTQRQSLLCQNQGSNNMGLYFSSVSEGNTTPTPTGIGSGKVFTLYPAGSYEPQGGVVYTGAIWVIGTINDNLSCILSQTQP